MALGSKDKAHGAGSTGGYPPVTMNRRNTGGLVQVPAQGARTTQDPGPNIGLRGTLKK